MVWSALGRVARTGLAVLVGAGALAAGPAAAQQGSGGGDPHFQYGNYCGGGVPAQSAPVGDAPMRLAVLEAWWSPRDDLDAYCFAHDYCFEMLGNDALVCDAAMEQVLGRFARSSQAGCAAMAGNMYKAFVYKPWSRGGFGRLSGAARMINQAGELGGNDARDLLLNMALARADGIGQGGVCNIYSDPNPRAAINQFVSQVRYLGGVNDFSICAPDDRREGRCEHRAPTDIDSLADRYDSGQVQEDIEEIGRAVEAIGNLFGR